MPLMARYDPFSPTFDHPLLSSSPDYTSRNGGFNNTSRGFGSSMSFRERNKALKDLETEKSQLIEDLLYQLETTQDQLRKLQFEQRNESQYNREFEAREKSLQDQLRLTKQIMDRNSFIIALIDGDGTIFSKDLLSRGEDGGKQAATLCANAMNELISHNFPHLNSPRIVLRICTNLTSLTDLLLRSRFIDTASIMSDFVRGFNSARSLFEIVDAGTKKDAAGDKICELLRLNLYDCHCHQVILGASHNPNYVPILEEVINDQQVVSHLTLLEGVPFSDKLAGLRHNFPSIKYDFFCDKIPEPAPIIPKAPPAVAAAMPALSRVDSNRTTGNSSASSTPAITWSNMVAKAPATLQPPPAVKPVSEVVKRPDPPNTVASGPLSKTGKVKTIEKNRLGQRIDKSDKSIPNYEIQRVKKLKLCNTYYLQGKDLCTSSTCTHRHDYPISNSERKTLREVARMTPCYSKTACEDADCIFGHLCPQNDPNDSSCYYGESCRFWGFGHGIDTRVVKITKV